MLIGTLPSSLYNFRGELLSKLNILASSVDGLASDASSEDILKIKETGANYVDYPVSRSGLSPNEDFKTYKALKSIFKLKKPNVILAYTIKPGLIYSKYNYSTIEKSVISINVYGFSYVLKKTLSSTIP